MRKKLENPKNSVNIPRKSELTWQCEKDALLYFLFILSWTPKTRKTREFLEPSSNPEIRFRFRPEVFKNPLRKTSGNIPVQATTPKLLIRSFAHFPNEPNLQHFNSFFKNTFSDYSTSSKYSIHLLQVILKMKKYFIGSDVSVTVRKLYFGTV